MSLLLKAFRVNKIVLVLTLYLIALFQSGFWPHLSLYGVWPNLVLLATMLIILKSKDRFTIWLTAFWGGWLLGVFHYQQTGLALLALLLLTALLQLARRYFVFEGMAIVLASLALLVLSYEPLLYLLSLVASRFPGLSAGTVSLDWYTLVVQLLYNMILVVLFWLILPAKLKDRFAS